MVGYLQIVYYVDIITPNLSSHRTYLNGLSYKVSDQEKEIMEWWLRRFANNIPESKYTYGVKFVEHSNDIFSTHQDYVWCNRKEINNIVNLIDNFCEDKLEFISLSIEKTGSRLDIVRVKRSDTIYEGTREMDWGIKSYCSCNIL